MKRQIKKGIIFVTFLAIGWGGGSEGLAGEHNPPRARLSIRMNAATAPAAVHDQVEGVIREGDGASIPSPGDAVIYQGTLGETAGAACEAALPAGPQELWRRARVEAQNGAWQESLAIYRQVQDAFAGQPENDQIALESAEILTKLARPGEATATLEKILARKPSPPLAARTALALHTLNFQRQNGKDKPVTAFQEYWRQLDQLGKLGHWTPEEREHLDRLGMWAWDGLMETLREKGDIPVAVLENLITLWDQSRAASRPSTGAFFWAEKLYQKGLNSEAARFYLSALQNPQAGVRANCFSRLVDIYRDLNDWSRWEETLGRWREDAGGLPPRRLAELGRAQLLNGKVAAAAATLEEALTGEEAAQVPENWLALARAQEQRREVDKAIQTMEQAVKRNLSGDDIHKMLAELYYRRGLYDKAAPVYQKLLEAAPLSDQGFFMERLGVCYTKVQQFNQAHRVFRELAQRGDDFWQKLAMAHLQSLSGYGEGYQETN